MTIKAETLFKKWHKNPKFRREYEALEEEFDLARALIDARSRANLSQEELADRMETSQSVVARLESGRGNPSLSTLSRYAEATGTRLKIDFQPIQ